MSQRPDSTNVESTPQQVESTLQQKVIHDNWENQYRTEENEKFYDLAFNEILRIINPKENSSLLDAGCGPCNYTIRLAKSGKFGSITAADVSESALGLAALKLKENGMDSKITLKQENLTSLSFPDESFDYILCWGVLMHIPEVDKAVRELSRVLKKGGTLIISEINIQSYQSVTIDTLKRILHKKGKAEAKSTDAGTEYWHETPDGKLMVRYSNNAWFINQFKSHGLALKNHFAGQFSECYTLTSSKLLASLIHSFNSFYFKHIKSPHPAFGNIFIFEKIR